MLDPRAAQQFPENRLRIGLRFHAQFGVAAVVVHLDHAGQIFECTVAVARAHADRVLAVLGLDRFQSAVEHLPAAADHENRVAHPLGDVHVVRGEDHRGAAAMQRNNRVLEHFHIQRIEPGKGSSSTSSLGRATTAEMNCTFWAMPFESVSIRSSSPVGQVETLEPLIDFAAAVAESFEPGVIGQKIADLHPLVQPAFLGQVAHAIVGHPASLASQHADPAAFGIEDPQDHPERGGLARSVGSDEAVNSPFGHRQIEAIDGHVIAESFGHIL